MRRRSGVLAVSSFWLMTACHSSTAASGPFAGHWLGNDASGTVTVDITLKDASDGGITGSGSIYGSGVSAGTIPVSVTGSESGGSAAVTLNAPPFTHANLSGAMANGLWAAVLDGSGFVSDSVKLQRQ